MRPILILLIAKSFGKVSPTTQHAAVGLELLHTASLIHDDVVDESNERRGQASVNASYNNKVAVLVGDYVLSTALQQVGYTNSNSIVKYLAELGQTLSDGEILQLSNIKREEITEAAYLEIIARKTAILFEICAAIGAESAGVSEEDVALARAFGKNIGMIFQIRDDIFDYFESEKEIGKPTGNDLTEGKLTLPLIYALNKTGDERMMMLARKAKMLSISSKEIEELVTFAKEKGGIEYAEECMKRYHAKAKVFIDTKISNPVIKQSLSTYLDYIIKRNK